MSTVLLGWRIEHGFFVASIGALRGGIFLPPLPPRPFAPGGDEGEPEQPIWFFRADYGATGGPSWLCVRRC